MVTKSLQASRGSPASPECAGADQLCLADSCWQLGCGRSDHREPPDESCSRNSTLSQRGDIWQHATRRKIAPIQTKHFKLLISSQAAAVRWDRGICALSTGAGDRNTTKITAVCKPTFAATAPSPAEALHRLQILWCCSASAPAPHRPAGDPVCGTPRDTITSVSGFMCPHKDAECSESHSSRRFRQR